MSRFTITRDAIERALQSIAPSSSALPPSPTPKSENCVAQEKRASLKSEVVMRQKRTRTLHSSGKRSPRPRLMIVSRGEILQRRASVSCLSQPNDENEDPDNDGHSNDSTEKRREAQPVLSELKTGCVNRSTSLRDSCLFSGVPATEQRFLRTRIMELDPDIRHIYSIDYHTLMQNKEHHMERCKYYVHWKRMGSDRVKQELKADNNVCIINLSNMTELSSSIRIHVRRFERQRIVGAVRSKYFDNDERSTDKRIVPDWTQFTYRREHTSQDCSPPSRI